MVNQTVTYFKSVVKTAETLDDKEKEVLLKRLEKKTLKKIGRKHKLTAERIRQIEGKALKDIKKPYAQMKIW